MSTESQFLPGIPPLTLFAWLEQVDLRRFSPKKTGRPYQRLRDLDDEAADILQQIRAGNTKQRDRLCQIGRERQRLRRDLLAMLALHMALIRREMKGPQASQYDQALARSSKVLGEGGKIFEFMDQRTLQKVFEQAKDLIEFEGVLRSQAGRKLEEWAPAAKLKALKLGLDTLTRYLPLPKGTDQFFKFYSEAIGAIANGVAPIEKRIREQRLEQINYESFRSHPEAWQTLKQWDDQIKKYTKSEGKGIAHDAVKLAWIGTYLDRNKELADKLIRDEIGKQIAELCPPPTPLEQLEEASRVRGEKEPLPDWGWKAPQEIEKEWEEWRRKAEPRWGATPEEIARANREAELEKQCAARKKEARAAQSRCDEKRAQVRAAEEKARREGKQRTAAFERDKDQIEDDYYQACQGIRSKYDAVKEQERQVRQMEMELARLRTGASVAIAVGEADQKIEAQYAQEEAKANQAYQAATERWEQGLGTRAEFENAFAKLEDVWARKKQDQQALKAKKAELQRQLEAQCAKLQEKITNLEEEISAQRTQELKELEAEQQKRDRRLRELQQARQKEKASAEGELPKLRTEAAKACQEAQRALEEQKKACDEWQRVHADRETRRALKCVEERLRYQVPQVMRILESLLVGEREIERLLKDTRATIEMVEGLAQTSPQDREKEEEDIEKLEGRRWSIVRQCFNVSRYLDLVHYVEMHRTDRIDQPKALSGESRFSPFLSEETIAAMYRTPATRQEAIAALRREMALLEDGLQRMRRCREELERQFAPLVDELAACIEKSGPVGPAQRTRWRKEIAQLKEDSSRIEGKTGPKVKELLDKLTVREPAKRGLGEVPAGLKWAIGALIVVLSLCCTCMVGGGAIVGGRIIWERGRILEPTERVALATITPAPQQMDKEAERQATKIVEVVPTITAEVQVTRETVEPPPEQEEVVPPTHTPTPTRTPTITPTPTEALPSGPEERVFVAEDGQELVGTYYPPPACPSPLTIVYFPWVRGDKEDAREIINLLPGDLSYGVFAITPRGCEGGCQEWNPSAWLLDYRAAMEAAKELPCAGQGPIVTIGSSVGADGAIVACAREARCVGAFAVSPGGYTGEFTYADEVAIAVERGKPVWSVVSEDDPESARLDRPGLGDGYREIVIPGGDHGNQLYDERTAQVVQDFVECATNAFASPRCLEALAEDHLAKGNEHLEQVKDHYQDHDCEHWIPGAEQAIRECTTAIKLNPDSAGAYFCRALGNTYIEDPAKAIDDLERALELGLTGKEKSDAEELLKGLKEKVAAPACSIGPVLFSEGWTEFGSPLDPSETCSEDITNEIRTVWELYGSCNQQMAVKWLYNNRLTCFHYYRPGEHEQWEGSIYHTEEKALPSGTWTVSVSIGGQEIGSASCDLPWPEIEPPIPATLFLAFNTARPPFDVPSVRRALAMAIDREALLDLLGREDKLAARGFVPPSLWADESYYGQADMPFDPQRALKLLAHSTHGHEAYEKWSIELECLGSSQKIAEFIQAQWKEHLGIEVDLAVVEEDAYTEGLEALSAHVFLASWHAESKSPYNFLGDAVQDISKLTQWSNAEYDRLVEQAFQEANQNRRMELYGEAEWILCYDEAGIIPIYYYTHSSD